MILKVYKALVNCYVKAIRSKGVRLAKLGRLLFYAGGEKKKSANHLGNGYSIFLTMF